MQFQSQRDAVTILFLRSDGNHVPLEESAVASSEAAKTKGKQKARLVSQDRLAHSPQPAYHGTVAKRRKGANGYFARDGNVG
jgi:hypothetical protein